MPPCRRASRGSSSTRTSRHGLFFPIDPGADAAFAASRPPAPRHQRGPVRHDAENVLALDVVLADGTVTAARGGPASPRGYDLARLCRLGGTLGIITELTLRLYGIPGAMSSAVWPRESRGRGRYRHKPSRRIRRRASSSWTTRRSTPSTVLRGWVEGGANTVLGPRQRGQRARAGGTVGRIAAGFGDRRSDGPPARRSGADCGRRATTSPTPARRSDRARRSGPPTLSADRASPVHRGDEAGHPRVPPHGPIVGPVGDGNCHVTLLVDKSHPEELRQVKGVSERLVRHALAMEGASTGEPASASADRLPGRGLRRRGIRDAIDQARAGSRRSAEPGKDRHMQA